MNNLTCEKCGSNNIVSGQISTSLGFSFTPENKIFHKPKQGLFCDICKDCGHVQNLHVINPKNL